LGNCPLRAVFGSAGNRPEKVLPLAEAECFFRNCYQT
jgi:hypothetical protein